MVSTLWYGAARTPKETSRVAGPGPSDAYPVAPIHDRHRSYPWVIPVRRLRYARRATDQSIGWFPLHQPGIEVPQ